MIPLSDAAEPPSPASETSGAAETGRIAFAIAGGPSLGLGHVMRCAALAAASKRRGWRVHAFLQGPAEVEQTWRAASEGVDSSPWRDWSPAYRHDLIVLDFAGDKRAWLERAESTATPAVVIDDADYLDRARLTICPAIHSQTRELPRFIAGPRFSILSRAHLRCAPRRPESKTRLLLSLGGADPHHATLRVAPVLARVLDELQPGHAFRSRDVVLGAAFEDSGQHAAAELARAGWCVHRGLSMQRMALLMAQSGLAVIGFGTSLTELAWHRTPHLSITHHASDASAAQGLETRGIGRHLGWAPSLDLQFVEAVLREALEKASWRKTSAELAYRAIDAGRGVERILKRFEEIVPSLPRRAARTASVPPPA